jgi:hypothetical protein
MDHIQAEAIAGTASFRLEASGACAVCGDGVCRKFSPGAA